MKHEQAWKLLPDLLEDRDDPELLAHVRACSECQRQLFLLGRVDRLLQDAGSTRGRLPTRGRRTWRLFLFAAAMTAVVTATAFALVAPHHAGRHKMTLRTASGRSVGEALIARSDARNVSLALTARGLPVRHGHVYVLWAGDQRRARMQVGRFMVDRTGGCRVRFNLPATHGWDRFWVTSPREPSAVVAGT